MITKNNVNEAGFSLIELAVSCLILTTLSATAFTFYANAADKIKANAEQASFEQANADANVDALIKGGF